MVVSTRDAHVIRQTLPLVEARIASASAAFYVNLFALAPEMRALFRGDDLAGQGMRFMSTLIVIAEIADDPERLGQAAERLAATHALADVRREHLEPMGCALMVTLGEALGPAFTLEVQRAWRAAYDAVAGAMMTRLPRLAHHGD